MEPELLLGDNHIALGRMNKEQIYSTVLGPVVTEKDTMGSEHGQVSFRVAMNATKPRIQEAVEKFQSFSDMPKLIKRFIGHLQSNKVNKCLDLFDAVDSVDSIKLARKISNRATSLGKTVPVLLEVNTSREPQKGGFNPGMVDEMLSCLNEKNIQVNGLMTVGPNTRDEDKIRQSFTDLRELSHYLNQQCGESRFKELSMGMSGDYELAVEEGSTIVRLGTALFGPRE